MWCSRQFRKYVSSKPNSSVHVEDETCVSFWSMISLFCLSLGENSILLCYSFSLEQWEREWVVSEWLTSSERKSCVIFSSSCFSFLIKNWCCWEKVRKKWWRRRFQSSIKSVSQTNRVTDNDFSFSFSQEILCKTRRGMFILHTTWIEREISFSDDFRNWTESLSSQRRRSHDTKRSRLLSFRVHLTEFNILSRFFVILWDDEVSGGECEGIWYGLREEEEAVSSGIKKWVWNWLWSWGWTEEGGRDQDSNEYETRILPDDEIHLSDKQRESKFFRGISSLVTRTKYEKQYSFQVTLLWWVWEESMTRIEGKRVRMYSKQSWPWGAKEGGIDIHEMDCRPLTSLSKAKQRDWNHERKDCLEGEGRGTRRGT